MALMLLASSASAQSVSMVDYSSSSFPPPEIIFQGEATVIVRGEALFEGVPSGGTAGVIADYVGVDIPNVVSTSAGSGKRDFAVVIPPIQRRTCFPSCTDVMTVAESLVEVPDRIDIIPVILNAQEQVVATGEVTMIPVSKTGEVTIAPSNQPLQTRQRVRVTMEDANFTEGGATVYFRDTRDARGTDPIATINWSASSNRQRVCGNMQPIRQVVACAQEIVDDTTFEFTVDTFLLPDDAARYEGQTYDIIAASAAGANVALNAWRFGGPATAPPPPMISSIDPDSAGIGGPGFALTVNGSNFAPDAVLLWDAVRLDPQTITPAKLTANIPASLLQPDVPTAAVAKPTRRTADGGREVEVRVENPGLSEDAVMISNGLKFLLTPSAPAHSDVIVRDMEVVQSVQDPANSVRRAAGKRTVVRVYLGLTEGSTRTAELVGVTLAGFRDQQPLPGQPTVIRGNVRPLSFGEEPDRDHISSSAVFELPISWTSPGSITLAATAHPDPQAFPMEDAANNELRAGLTFAARSSLTVNYYRVCFAAQGGELRCPEERRISSPGGLDFVQKTFPIPERGVHYGAAGSTMSFGGAFYHQIELEVERPGDTEDIWRELIYKAFAAQRLPGVIPADVSIFWFPPWTADFPESFRRLAVPLNQDRDSFLTADRIDAKNTMALAVALGKSLGRASLGCGNDSRRTIGEESGVGFDVVERQIRPSSSPGFSDFGPPCPTQAMWISPASVKQMFDSVRIQPATGARLSEERRQGTEPAVFVSGLFRKDGTSATLDPAFLLPAGSHLDDLPDSGTYCVVFEGQGGTIARYCPDLAFTLPEGFDSESGETALEEDVFGFAVSVPLGATKIGLTFNGAELASKTASVTPPTVMFTEPQPGDRWDGGFRRIAWSGADADGDPLAYMLLASRDGTANWSVLDSRLAQENFQIDTDLANGGPNVYFRVLASDGLHTAEATVGPVDVVARPVISVTPETIEIDPVVVGFDHQQSLVLFNEGNGILSVTAVESDNSAFEVLLPETPFDIPAQAAARVTLRYAPTGVGSDRGVLTVRSNATNEPELRINISAAAVDASTPTIRVSEESLSFGEVATGQSLTLPVVISSFSAAELSVEYELQGGAYSIMESRPSPLVLMGVDQEIIRILFVPDREGDFGGTLRLASNDPNRPLVEVEITGTGVPSTAAPGLPPSVDAVVNGGSFLEVIAPGSWVTIFGQNLAATTTNWNSAIQGSDLPTLVAGVQVLFDGAPGAVSFVSPTQINVQAPDGLAGEVEVRVIVNGVTGQPSIADIRSLAPALFAFGQGQALYAAAVHLDGVIVGPEGIFGGAAPTRPARAGDRLLVFGTGFGPTNPPVPAGQLFQGAARLTNPTRFLIGGREAVVEFAGLSAAGLNQFNVIVPDGLASGNHAIVVEVGSAQTQPDVLLSVTGSSGGDPGNGSIEIQLVEAEFALPEAGVLIYAWSAALPDTRAKSLRIDVLLSEDDQIGTGDVLLLRENRETQQGQSGLGAQDVVIVPESVPDGEYFLGILITDLESGEQSRSNVLPIEIAR